MLLAESEGGNANFLLTGCGAEDLAGCAAEGLTGWLIREFCIHRYVGTHAPGNLALFL